MTSVQHTIKCRDTGEPLASKSDGGTCVCPPGVCRKDTVAIDKHYIPSLLQGWSDHVRDPQDRALLLAAAERIEELQREGAGRYWEGRWRSEAAAHTGLACAVGLLVNDVERGITQIELIPERLRMALEESRSGRG